MKHGLRSKEQGGLDIDYFLLAIYEVGKREKGEKEYRISNKEFRMMKLETLGPRHINDY